MTTGPLYHRKNVRVFWRKRIQMLKMHGTSGIRIWPMKNDETCNRTVSPCPYYQLAEGERLGVTSWHASSLARTTLHLWVRNGFDPGPAGEWPIFRMTRASTGNFGSIIKNNHPYASQVTSEGCNAGHRLISSRNRLFFHKDYKTMLLGVKSKCMMMGELSLFPTWNGSLLLYVAGFACLETFAWTEVYFNSSNA
jgi:hypothetical protein